MKVLHQSSSYVSCFIADLHDQKKNFVNIFNIKLQLNWHFKSVNQGDEKRLQEVLHYTSLCVDLLSLQI